MKLISYGLLILLHKLSISRTWRRRLLLPKPISTPSFIEVTRWWCIWMNRYRLWIALEQEITKSKAPMYTAVDSFEVASYSNSNSILSLLSIELSRSKLDLLNSFMVSIVDSNVETSSSKSNDFVPLPLNSALFSSVAHEAINRVGDCTHKCTQLITFNAHIFQRIYTILQEREGCR